VLDCLREQNNISIAVIQELSANLQEFKDLSRHIKDMLAEFDKRLNEIRQELNDKNLKP
jgi:prefoldin subunit 5